jgi:hypothetical protein
MTGMHFRQTFLENDSLRGIYVEYDIEEDMVMLLSP